METTHPTCFGAFGFLDIGCLLPLPQMMAGVVPKNLPLEDFCGRHPGPRKRARAFMTKDAPLERFCGACAAVMNPTKFGTGLRQLGPKARPLWDHFLAKPVTSSATGAGCGAAMIKHRLAPSAIHSFVVLRTLRSLGISRSMYTTLSSLQRSIYRPKTCPECGRLPPHPQTIGF